MMLLRCVGFVDRYPSVFYVWDNTIVFYLRFEIYFFWECVVGGSCTYPKIDRYNIYIYIYIYIYI